MLLEYSGRPLGVLHWMTQIKQLAILALAAALFLPWGMALDSSPVALLIGFGAFAVKVGVLGMLLAAIETSFAKLRIFQAPYVLGFASVLGILAILATYVVAGPS
jgi:formate hydrogenlyase subunit 4